MLLVTATSCAMIFDCIEGNGNVQTEDRTATDITSIANSTSFYVEYQKSEVVSITVEAESNLLPHIDTRIRNNSLEVRTTPGTGCIRYSVQPRIIITAPSVDELVNSGSGEIVAGLLEGVNVNLVSSGSGDITTENILCSSATFSLSGSGTIATGTITSDEIKVAVSGSGNINTSGAAGDGKFIISGSGKINAEDLESENADITISGSGSVTTTILQYLDAVISGSGNIYLYGDPEIKIIRSGSGKIINR